MAYVSFGVEIDFTQVAGFSFLLIETGGGSASGTVSFGTADGRMFIGSSGVVSGVTYVDFLQVLEDKLNAIGNATYTVVFDQGATSNPHISITATGGSVTAFQITMASDQWRRISGFWTDPSGALTYTASKQPWYWMRASEGFLSQWPLDYEDGEDLAKDTLSHDAVAYGTARDAAAIMFDATSPLEPRQLIWDTYCDKSGVLEAYTWQKFFKDTRNTSLYAVKINGHTQHPDSTRFVRMREDGVAFKPQARVEGYWDYVDIVFRGRVAKLVLDGEAPPPVEWSPLDLGTTLKVWLQPTGITNASGFASGWVDDSGNSYDFTQATSGARPAVGTYSGLPMIDADGTDDVLSRAFMAGILSGQYGVYLVFKADGANGTGAGFYTNDGIICDSNQYWGVYLRDASGTYQVALYHWDTSAKTSINTLSLGTWYWMEGTYDGVNLNSRLAGTGGTSPAAAVVNAGIGGSCHIARGSAGGMFSDVSVAEILITNSVLSGANLTNLRTYINTKYGLTT